MLSETLLRDVPDYRKALEEHIAKAVETRGRLFPSIPLVVGEAGTYCAHPRMRWEEKSDAYWSLIDSAAELLRRKEHWGCMPRTNSGPEDPSWTEFPERLRRANNIFLSNVD